MERSHFTALPGETVTVGIATSGTNNVTLVTLGGVELPLLRTWTYSSSAHAIVRIPPNTQPGIYNLRVTTATTDETMAGFEIVAYGGKTRLYLTHHDGTVGDVSYARMLTEVSYSKFPSSEQAIAVDNGNGVGFPGSNEQLLSSKGSYIGGAGPRALVYAGWRAAQNAGNSRYWVGGNVLKCFLYGVTKIPACRWKIAQSLRGTVGSRGDKVNLFVWRPTGHATGSVVATIFDNTNDDTPLSAAISSSVSNNLCRFEFDGAAADNLQDMDVLVLERWAAYTGAGTAEHYFNYGGIVDIPDGDADGSASTSTAAGYIEALTELFIGVPRTENLPLATTGASLITGRATGDGPYIYEPLASPAVTAIQTATTSVIQARESFRVLPVADASLFPDAEGYLCFGLGWDYQASPVRYIGKTSAGLLLDPNYRFTKSIPAGSTVILLAGKEAHEPGADAASLSLTNSGLGLRSAEATIDHIRASGLPLKKEISYPPDHGYGGAGAATKGDGKLSDVVRVFGGDNLDEEVEKARER